MRSVPARVGGILALAAGAFVGARLVDAGYTRAWPIRARFMWASALLFTIVGAVVLLHSLLSPQHSELGPELQSDHRGPALRRGLFVASAGFLVFFAVAKAAQAYAAIPVERTFLVAMGTVLAWCTIQKPWWFWGHWKAHFLRSLIGDGATTVVYLLLAGCFFYLGLFGDVSGF